MIAVTATLAVLKRQSSPALIQVVTILKDLADIRPYDAIAPALPTYEEAVCVAADRGNGPRAAHRIPQAIRYSGSRRI